MELESTRELPSRRVSIRSDKSNKSKYTCHSKLAKSILFKSLKDTKESMAQKEKDVITHLALLQESIANLDKEEQKLQRTLRGHLMAQLELGRGLLASMRL